MLYEGDDLMKEELDLKTLMNKEGLERYKQNVKQISDSSQDVEIIFNPNQEGDVEVDLDELLNFKDVIPEDLDNLLAIKTVFDQNYGKDSLKLYKTDEGIKMEFVPTDKSLSSEHLKLIQESNNYGLPFEFGDGSCCEVESLSEQKQPNGLIEKLSDFEGKLIDKATDKILISLDKGLSKLKNKFKKV